LTRNGRLLAARFHITMEKISFVDARTHLFRFLNPAAEHFWPTIRDLLSERTLFLNSRKNFNDPYDSRPIIDNDLSSAAVRAYRSAEYASSLDTVTCH
jgi:hypothetical protein